MQVKPTLVVRVGRRPAILMALLGIWFVPLGLFFLYKGLSGGPETVPLGLGALMLLMFGAIFWLVRRGHGRSVSRFTAEGLVRNDGTHLSWADLSGVVRQVRLTSYTHKSRSLWRIEVRFSDGRSAWLIPGRIANLSEVERLVGGLSCPHSEEIVGAV